MPRKILFACLSNLALFATGTLAQPVPDETDMIDRIAWIIPVGWEVGGYTEIAALRNADPITPELRLRFEAEVVPSETLFAAMDSFLGPARIIVPTREAVEAALLDGTALFSYDNGTWEGPIDLETNLVAFGEPIGNFQSLVVEEGSTIYQRMKEVRESEIEMMQATAASRGTEIYALQEALADAKERTEESLQRTTELEKRLAASLAARLAAETSLKDTREQLSAARMSQRTAEQRTELLNTQVTALRQQLAELRSLLDGAPSHDR